MHNFFSVVYILKVTTAKLQCTKVGGGGGGGGGMLVFHYMGVGEGGVLQQALN